MAAENWTTGIYSATDAFRSIREYVAVCDAETNGLIAVVGPAGDAESERIARLFAAGRDLLAALEYIIGWNPNGWNAETARDLAKAAIEKATGQPYRPHWEHKEPDTCPT